jgi:hypothetical protein
MVTSFVEGRAGMAKRSARDPLQGSDGQAGEGGK